MTWPQAFMLALFIVSFIASFTRLCHDETKSSGTVTAVVLFVLGFLVLEAWVLHEGGFW